MNHKSFSPTRALLFLVWFACIRIASAADPFFFIQLSDPQFGMFTTNRDFVQETANFEFAVASINRLHPAFVVITGDLVNKPGDTAQIAEFKRIAAKIDSRVPVYKVAGNHDIQNAPIPESLAAYTNQFGTDHYEFRHNDFVGIVLDSTLMHAPEKVHDLYAGQEAWFESELEKVSRQKPAHIVIFQHHSWFLNKADEPDEYFNIPSARRTKYLQLFHKFGVKYAFCGHYHRNKIARDGDLEVVTTSAVGKPLAGESGMRIVVVRGDGIEHRFYGFGDIPNYIDPNAKLPRSHSND
jgi:serine/threonine-protein phosphatase CPPED1